MNQRFDIVRKAKPTRPPAYISAASIGHDVVWHSFSFYPRLAAVDAYFCVDPSAPFSLSQAANLACMTPKSFSRYFRIKVGVTFTEWKHIMRTKLALQYLQEKDCAIGEVARLCGYTTRRSFERTFRRLVGVSPREIQRMVQPENMSSD